MTMLPAEEAEPDETAPRRRRPLSNPAAVKDLESLVQDQGIRLEQQEKLITHLMEALSTSGIKTQLDYDVFGRVFDLPVDEEHRATRLKLGSFRRPHMRQFHACWIGFFTAFAGTFASAPLMPYIRADLNMTKSQVGFAGVASISGGVLGRLTMGAICDKYGPRNGMSILLFACSIANFCMDAVHSAEAFIACRLLIGFSLSTFVSCQYWTSRMFSRDIVGLANATTAGWGNLGGGVTQLMMPLIFLAVKGMGGDPGEVSDSAAWRFSLMVPGLLMLLGGFLVRTAQDLPDGNYGELEQSMLKQRTEAVSTAKLGFSNLNAWWAHICYGMCFGVELTMNNIAALYFHDHFGMSVVVAGTLASLFGLMNLCARSAGGLLSDTCNAKYGMRGRLWFMWVSITTGGILCILMGLQEKVGSAVFFMVLFSCSVQASEGAVFGVVPSINPSIVGAGGNVFSALMQIVFFRGQYNINEGIVGMGFAIISLAFTAFFIYFPDEGGMIFPARTFGKFDPQLIKGTGDTGVDTGKQAGTSTTSAVA